MFVFAITQLSHRLLSHLTTDGALKTILLFLPVWGCGSALDDQLARSGARQCPADAHPDDAGRASTCNRDSGRFWRRRVAVFGKL
ncbi:MAG: hypothetical protein IPF48_04110 [Sphingomonadales bacterium]|nr:hypothetical protein [Sphingomonadales bacterium]